MAMPAPAAVPNGLADYLCFSTYSANLAFNRVYKPLLDALGLTYPQYLALVLLWAEDDQTVGQLGDKLFLESNTLTPLLKRLEALGHVARSRDPKDERVVRIRLTDKGREQLAAIDAYRLRISEVYRKLFDEVGDAHRVITDTLIALEKRPLSERVSEAPP